MSFSKKFDPRILHINFSKTPPLGVVEQLRSEVSAVQKLGIAWDTVLIGASECSQPFYIRQIRALPGPVRWFLVYLYILKNRKRYDIILMRCIKADFLGWLFVPFVKNIIFVHHTKEIEECQNVEPSWYGLLLSEIEKTFGRLKLKKTKFVAAVTKEIANYEINRIGIKKQTLVIPNGIDINSCKVIEDKRNTSLSAIFVASKFESWHGLDLLLESYKNNSNCKLHIHLVGQVSATDMEKIDKINNISKRIFTYGILPKDKIFELMEKCDLGLGSFALFRNKLTEACTLKTREYLACGLSVYANHVDSGLPRDFEFFVNGDPDVENIYKAAQSLRAFSRKKVAEASFKYIDKTNILSSVYDKIKLLI